MTAVLESTLGGYGQGFVRFSQETGCVALFYIVYGLIIHFR